MFHVVVVILSLVSSMACSSHAARKPGYVPPHIARDAERWWARVQHEDYVSCFAADTTYAPEKLAYCEISGVVYDGKRVIVTNDKTIPGEKTSPIFTVEYDGKKPRLGAVQQFLTAPAITQGQKYEDITRTADGKFVIATTGFDRFRADDAQLDDFNRLVAWPVDRPEAACAIQPYALGAATDDRPARQLRQHITEALRGLHNTQHRANAEEAHAAGPAYFKIEGVAALPDQRLVLGVREVGEAADDFTYHVVLLTAPYRVNADQLVLIGPFAPLYHHEDLNQVIGQKRPIAVSGLTWDPYQGVLWMLTSYETSATDEDVGGYLWALSIDDMMGKHPPRLVRMPNGSPLHFAHKAEGITVLGPGELLIVHDDDRIVGRDQITDANTQFNRRPEQSAYTFLHIDHIVP